MKKLLLLFMLCLCTVSPAQYSNVQSKNGYATYYSVKSNGGTRTASENTIKRLCSNRCKLPLCSGSIVRVTNPKNGKSVDVKITDRGPFAKSSNGVLLRPLRPHSKLIMDLSVAAARRIYSLEIGVIEVKTYKIK